MTDNQNVKVRANQFLTPAPLPTENKMLKNGHLPLTEKPAESEELLTHHGTICVRGIASDGSVNPEEAKALVLRSAQVPNPLPDDPAELPAPLQQFLRTGAIGNYTDPNGVQYNYRFIRNEADGQNHDLPNCIDPHSVEGRKDNFLCVWFKYGGDWAAELPYQFSALGSNTNECEQS